MWSGVVALGAAEVVRTAATAPDVLTIVGTAIGLGIFLAARRSIPVRIATSASAIVLAVVLGVRRSFRPCWPTASRTTQGRLLAEAGTEASIAGAAAPPFDRRPPAASRGLGGSMGEVLLRLTDPDDPDATRWRRLDRALQQLVDQLIGVDPAHGPVPWSRPIPSSPALLAVTPPDEAVDEAVIAQLQAGDAVADAIRGDGERQSAIAGHQGLRRRRRCGSTPSTSEITAGFLVVTAPLDSGYLQARQTLFGPRRRTRLKLLSRSGLVATSGDVGEPERLVVLAEAAIDGNGRPWPAPTSSCSPPSRCAVPTAHRSSPPSPPCRRPRSPRPARAVRAAVRDRRWTTLAALAPARSPASGSAPAAAT